MTYVVHKTKEIKDARARKEEVEGNARDKRKIELAFEKKFIKACKDEIILTDGHIAVETEQMEFVLQVKKIMEENRQKSSAIHICLNLQPLRVYLSRCTV